MNESLYIGIDVGGTNISAGLVNGHGRILFREKIPSPAKANAKTVLTTLQNLIRLVLDQNNLKFRAIKGIGFGIPGIVGSNHSDILAAPNINLSGVSMDTPLFSQTKRIGNLQREAILSALPKVLRDASPSPEKRFHSRRLAASVARWRTGAARCGRHSRPRQRA